MQNQDPRIGVYGESEPQLCAVTGNPVQGRHAVSYDLDNRHFYRVLTQAISSLTAEKHSEILSLVTPQASLLPEQVNQEESHE